MWMLRPVCLMLGVVRKIVLGCAGSLLQELASGLEV